MLKNVGGGNCHRCFAGSAAYGCASVQVQLLRRHYTLARVTSSSDVTRRVQTSDRLSKNNISVEREAKTKSTELRSAADMDAAV